MPVNLVAADPASLLAVPGVQLGAAQAGIRKPGRFDLLVLSLVDGSSVAGVFTRNRFCAAPVQVCREHLGAETGLRALVINTGNANAGTGADGLARARSTCVAVAERLQLSPAQVLPFSTGVIMETLPLERITAGLPAAVADLKPDHWALAAQAIMTTDTLPKAASRQVAIAGRTVTVTGIGTLVDLTAADSTHQMLLMLKPRKPGTCSRHNRTLERILEFRTAGESEPCRKDEICAWVQYMINTGAGKNSPLAGL